MIADMETECYPCIPMHSASNQKRMNHSTITMIKTEPLSEDVNVTVIDDEQDARSAMAGITSKAGVTRQQQKPRKRVQNQLQQTTSATAAAAQASKMQQHTIRLSRVS